MVRSFAVICTLSAFLLVCNALAVDHPKCAYEDSECLIRVANEIVSKGNTDQNGLGLGVFDPKNVDKCSINHKGQSVYLNIQLHDFVLRGLSGIKFTKIDGFKKDFEKARIEMNFRFPSLSAEGPYSIEGKLIVLPVEGKGQCSMNFTDNDVIVKIIGKKVERDGKMYLVAEKIKHTFDTAGSKTYFGGLFGGNQQELADTANLFFNENWRDILTEIKPALGDGIGEIYLNFFNKIFSVKPYDEFFLK